MTTMFRDTPLRAWTTTALAAAALATAAAAAAGCGADGAGAGTAAARDTASAGQWRTWVIGHPGSVRAPAPPRPGSAADQRDSRELEAAVRARTGRQERRLRAQFDRPAVQPWLERTMLLVARRPKDPVTASRNYALVSVAMYDAAVAAAHWQRRTDAKAPAGLDRIDARDGGGHPATAAAIAGAGSRVIAYAYPEYPAARLEQDAERIAADLVTAGLARPSGAEAGLALGRRVAERVVALAARDGSQRVWRGRLPRTRGAWRPPPGSAARPVQPLGGTWRTWVLRSGDEVRPEPPPPYGSPAFVEQARAVVETNRRLTAGEKRIAEFWAGGDGTELPPGRWIKVVLEYLRHQPPMSDVRLARIFALLNVAMADGGVAAWDAKYAYWVTRPENAIRDLGIARRWKPYLDTPFFPAYVSGHATYSGAAAEVLAHLFPADAGIWRKRAQEAAKSREYGGIHYPMDNEVGLRMGVEIGRRVVARARRDGADR